MPSPTYSNDSSGNRIYDNGNVEFSGQASPYDSNGPSNPIWGSASEAEAHGGGLVQGGKPGTGYYMPPANSATQRSMRGGGGYYGDAGTSILNMLGSMRGGGGAMSGYYRGPMSGGSMPRMPSARNWTVGPGTAGAIGVANYADVLRNQDLYSNNNSMSLEEQKALFAAKLREREMMLEGEMGMRNSWMNLMGQMEMQRRGFNNDAFQQANQYYLSHGIA